MTSIAPIYLPYYVLIDCCMLTCTCIHAKLRKTTFFLGQILNPKMSLFFGTDGVIIKGIKQCQLSKLPPQPCVKSRDKSNEVFDRRIRRWLL
jgi:hypothetical protein